MNVRLTVAITAAVALLSSGCGAAAEGYREGVGKPDSAPQSCLDALDAAEEAFGLAVEANDVMSNWIGAVPTQTEINQLNQITERLSPVSEEFNTKKAQCRGES